MNYASLFTGGGLADQGARAAGLRPVWGVEYDPQIAAVAQQNDPTGQIITASVCDVDYAALPHADVLHASPPCPNFSVAKTGRGETEHDKDLARAVGRAIEASRPALFTLENVRAYADSESFAIVTATLFALDYHVTTVILNAADHGVPQTRERLFLIAHAGGWMQASRPLPASTPWQGWYAAIEDILHTLPASQFAPWQLARLPESIGGTFLMRGANSQQQWGDGLPQPIAPAYSVTTDSPPRAFVMESLLMQNNDSEYGLPYRTGDAPVHAITTQTGGRARAFLMMSNRSGIEGAPVGQGDALPHEPANTVATRITSDARAWLVDTDSKTSTRYDGQPALTVVASRTPKAWLEQGRVVSMIPRALARFQSVPDTYVLPDSKSLACRIIGNGVACELYRRLLVSQLVLPSTRPAREAEQARKQIEAGTFAGQEYMLECLDALVRRGGG